MPRTWYDYKANALPANPGTEDVERREFNLRILAEKKPYFMRYVYPALMTQYNAYIKNTGIKCMRMFRIPIGDLLNMKDEELTDAQREFKRYYYMRMPVSINDCVVNRICRRFEREFSGVLKARPADAFDPSVFKSGQEYSQSRYYTILKLYKQYNEILCGYKRKRSSIRTYDDDNEYASRQNLVTSFAAECVSVCSNAKELCDIIVDACYSREGSKQFAWDICGMEMIRNLLEKHDYVITYPAKVQEGGEFSYGGYQFAMISKRSKVWEESY